MVRRQLSRLSVYDHAKLVALLRERQINEASVHKVYRYRARP